METFKFRLTENSDNLQMKPKYGPFLTRFELFLDLELLFLLEMTEILRLS